jgi:hypothetical protein
MIKVDSWPTPGGCARRGCAGGLAQAQGDKAREILFGNTQYQKR